MKGVLRAFTARLSESCAPSLLGLRELWTRDEGQDVVEYALLGAFIGIAGWLTLTNLDDTVGAVYTSWLNPDSGVPSLWIPPEPAGGGGS